MNIIILDLEWNSAYCKKIGGFLNEIIEIGAVKLDSNLNEVDRFQCFVCSSLTKRLRSSVKQLTNITNEQMRNGISLKEAFDRFANFAGENLLLTWSDTDIHVLIENSKILLNKDTIPFLYKYADIQKYIMHKMGVSGNQISLSSAAESAGIDLQLFAAHRALGDSLCCAEILRKFKLSDDIENYIVDATRPDYYKRFTFKSFPISDINSPLIDKKELYALCPYCQEDGARKTKWKYKNRNFSATFVCKQCKKKFIGRVRFKKTYDSVEVHHYSTPYKIKVKEETKQ